MAGKDSYSRHDQESNEFFPLRHLRPQFSVNITRISPGKLKLFPPFVTSRTFKKLETYKNLNKIMSLGLCYKLSKFSKTLSSSKNLKLNENFENIPKLKN